jgi:hypothetical protein
MKWFTNVQFPTRGPQSTHLDTDQRATIYGISITLWVSPASGSFTMVSGTATHGQLMRITEVCVSALALKSRGTVTVHWDYRCHLTAPQPKAGHDHGQVPNTRLVYARTCEASEISILYPCRGIRHITASLAEYHELERLPTKRVYSCPRRRREHVRNSPQAPPWLADALAHGKSSTACSDSAL